MLLLPFCNTQFQLLMSWWWWCISYLCFLSHFGLPCFYAVYSPARTSGLRAIRCGCLHKGWPMLVMGGCKCAVLYSVLFKAYHVLHGVYYKHIFRMVQISRTNDSHMQFFLFHRLKSSSALRMCMSTLDASPAVVCSTC